VVTATCLSAGPALAAELTVTGPDACPDAGELAFRVERSIGVPLAESAPLRFEVVFELPSAAEERYTARLEAHGRDGVTSARVIRARDCGRLGDAVSVAIALAIRSPAPSSSDATDSRAAEGSRTTSASSSTPSSVAASAAMGSDAGAAATNPAVAGPADTSARTAGAGSETAASIARDRSSSNASHTDEPTPAPALAAFFLVDTGSLPHAGAGMGLGAELHTARLALKAQGAFLFEQHVALEPGAGAAGADMSLVLGSLSGCWAALGSFRGRFAAFACAGWELGSLRAVGSGVDTPLRGAQLWTAPRADAGVSWALGGSWLRGTLQLSGLAPLKRDDFFIRDVGGVHRPPGAVGRLAIGVDVAFE
jgi:hypothetical protein